MEEWESVWRRRRRRIHKTQYYRQMEKHIDTGEIQEHDPKDTRHYM